MACWAYPEARDTFAKSSLQAYSLQKQAIHPHTLSSASPWLPGCQQKETDCQLGAACPAALTVTRPQRSLQVSSLSSMLALQN